MQAFIESNSLMASAAFSDIVDTLSVSPDGVFTGRRFPRAPFPKVLRKSTSVPNERRVFGLNNSSINICA
jgi:hypothetical protein